MSRANLIYVKDAARPHGRMARRREAKRACICVRVQDRGHGNIARVFHAPLWFSKDRTMNAETAGLLAYFRRARLVTILEAGHWLHHDKLDEVLGVLRPFLAT